MKNYIPVLLIVAFVVSCRSKDSSTTTAIKDSIVIEAPVKNDSANTIKDSHYFWEAEVGNKNGVIMKKTNPIIKDSLNPRDIIGMINATYPEIRLQFIRISHDSIFLKIANSTFLTQQMGSSGGEAYLAEVTYDLTELDNISHVNFTFKEGDHASPGTYERIDFIH